MPTASPTQTATVTPAGTATLTATPTASAGGLNVAITFNKEPPTYTFGEWVFITVTVTDTSGQPVSRANVHLEIVTASGVPVVQDGSTNRSGLVTFAFQPEPAHGAGTYSVTATATKSELSGSATRAFDVASTTASCEPCGFNGQVTLGLAVFAAGSPLMDASVLIQVTTPSGIVLSGGGVTDSRGEVTLSFTPVRSFGAGTYLVEAKGGVSWYAFSYASTFTVQ